MKYLRRLALSMVLLAIAGGLSSCHQPGEGGAVFQLNLWGYHGGSSTNWDIAPDTVYSIASRNPRPRIITFNEVCSAAQGNYFASNLPSEYIARVGSYTGPIGGGCGSFGLYIATVADAPTYYAATYSGLYDGGGRGFVCLKITSYGIGHVCTTHLTSGTTWQNDDDRSNEVSQILAFRRFAGAAVIAGDFNFLYFDGRHGYFSGAGLAETSGTPPSSAPTFKSKHDGHTERLDYIYLDDYLFNVEPPPYISAPLAHTDHFIYEGFVQ